MLLRPLAPPAAGVALASAGLISGSGENSTATASSRRIPAMTR